MSYTFTTQKPSALCLFIPPSLLTLGLFTVSIVLPFPEDHIFGIMQYVMFSNCLLSLSNINLSSLHDFSWLDEKSFHLFISF